MRHPASPRTRLSLPLLLGALALATPALAHDEVTVHEDSAEMTAADARWLTVELPVGKLEVRAGDVDRVMARLAVRCDEDSRRCRERAQNIRLRPRSEDDELTLEVIGYPKGNLGGDPPQAHLTIAVPRDLELRLEVGVGEVEVRGVAADLRVEVGVGEANVHVAEAAVRRVAMDVGIGEASLSPRPQSTRSSRFLFLGNEVDWRDGGGSANLDIEVGVGEASVRLQP